MKDEKKAKNRLQFRDIEYENRILFNHSEPERVAPEFRADTARL